MFGVGQHHWQFPCFCHDGAYVVIEHLDIGIIGKLHLSEAVGDGAGIRSIISKTAEQYKD